MQKHFSPWLIWGLGAALFFSEYFGRVAPGVMVPDLMRDFHVTAFALGGLSAFFYYPYVAMQVPVGMLVDRYGAHRLLAGSAVICAAGCIFFGLSDNLWSAQLGRALMGFSSSFAFVGALKLAATWFPPSRFGLLAGLTQALGMLGAAVGQAPMSFAVSTWGWRHAMILVASEFLILALFIALIVRDKAKPATALGQSKHNVWQGLKTVLANPQSWFNAIYAGLVYAPTAAFAELWGVSFLVQSYGLTTHIAATGVGMIFIGWGIGGPLIGWVSDCLGKRKNIMYLSAITGAVLMGIILYMPGLPVWLLFVLLFLFGISNTGVAVAYAVSAEINPRPVAGTSMAFANMASVIVGALFQPLIGALLDYHGKGIVVNDVPVYDAADFRFALVLLPVCLALGIVFCAFVRETYCRTVEQKDEDSGRGTCSPFPKQEPNSC